MASAELLDLPGMDIQTIVIRQTWVRWRLPAGSALNCFYLNIWLLLQAPSMNYCASSQRQHEAGYTFYYLYRRKRLSLPPGKIYAVEFLRHFTSIGETFMCAIFPSPLRDSCDFYSTQARSQTPPLHTGRSFSVSPISLPPSWMSSSLSLIINISFKLGVNMLITSCALAGGIKICLCTHTWWVVFASSLKTGTSTWWTCALNQALPAWISFCAFTPLPFTRFGSLPSFSLFVLCLSPRTTGS